MELKPDQQKVINDLSLFLELIQETKDTKEAFQNFWAKIYGHTNITMDKEDDLYVFGFQVI